MGTRKRGPTAKKPLTPFGQRLEDALMRSGRFDGNLTKLAVAAGTSYRTIYNYMREGTDPPSEVVRKLAEQLGVATDALLGAPPIHVPETHVVRDDTHPVIEAFILEQRLEPELAEDLRRHAHAAGGRFVRDELLMLLPAIRMRAARLKAEAEGKPDPAPRELPPVPEGRRRVPPGKKGR